MPSCIDYHTHMPHPGGGYLCTTRREEWDAAAGEERMIPCLGVHPWYATQHKPVQIFRDLELFLGRYPRAQVGESGLDDSKRAKSSLALQMEFLELHADAAMHHKRLLQLHGAGAWGKLLEWAKRRAKLGTLPSLHLHAWNGSPELAGEFLRLGASFSLGPREWHSPGAQRKYGIQMIGRLFPESDDKPETWPESLSLWEAWLNRREETSSS